MRKTILALFIAAAISPILFAVFFPGQWEGIDETVVSKFATEAGRAPSEPYIHGDVLLLAFLVGGAAAGFVAGYYFRVAFPPRSIESDSALHARSV
jgi:hypothetical protein